MIINTGIRTDIPAFYAKWFINRLEDALEIRKKDYEELSRTNLVDWRNDNGNSCN